MSTDDERTWHLTEGRKLIESRPHAASLTFIFNACLVLSVAVLGHAGMVKGAHGLDWFDCVAVLVAVLNLWLYGYRVWANRRWERRLGVWRTSVDAPLREQLH